MQKPYCLARSKPTLSARQGPPASVLRVNSFERPDRGPTMAGMLNEILARERFMLHDGRSVRVRELRRSDRELYRAAVAGLSPRSRYLRFAAPMPRISERLLEQMMDLDGDRHVAYAALTPDETAVVGVARFVRTADDPQVAEVAIAIADEWQGRGMGSLLVAALVDRARESGLRSLTAT